MSRGGTQTKGKKEAERMEAIVAVYTDWGIGSDGTQPIVVPEDRRRFAEITRGSTLIVGSKTLLDFPDGKPLAGRRNIVLTRHESAVEGAEVVTRRRRP